MKIAVLISGGVDSSVSLQLLKEQGYDVHAFYLKIWLEDELAYLGNCPWQEDLAYVEKICRTLSVPLHVISLQKEYWQHVVSYTISQVSAGRTPSPDLLCNQRIKFGCFLEHIDDSYDKVATGHYAQIDYVDGAYVLKKAIDAFKDQTYFLAYLNQKQLSRLMFPIGHLYKKQVRERAQVYDLPNKDRKDSQGICFLGKISFSDFIKHHLGEKQGNIVEFETNQILGQHQGFWFYTIGQRKGIGLSGGPWYVVAKNPVQNIIFVSKNYYSDEKIRNSFFVSDFNWISGSSPSRQDLQVKVRHGESFYQCHITFINQSKAYVTIDGNDQGLAEGQFAVFYDQEICLGSGIICADEQS